MNHRHRTAVISLALCIVAHIAAAGGHRDEPATTVELAAMVADLSAPAFSGRLTGSFRLEYEQPVIRQRRPLSVTVTDARGADRRLRAGVEAKLLIRPGISISGHVTGPVLIPDPMIRIEADYAVEQARVSNVAGVSPDGEGPPIVITAHFDGQGAADPDTRYPGAVDNASGVATAIAAALRLSSGTDRPVWVALFNGEEQGFYGSRAFVSGFRSAIDGATVVNVDMVAHSQTARFSVEANEDSAGLAARVVDALARRGAPARAGNAGGSDHVSFTGVAEAVSVVQAPYDAIHTTKDVPERFDESIAETLVEALVEVLSRSPADVTP